MKSKITLTTLTDFLAMVAVQVLVVHPWGLGGAINGYLNGETNVAPT